MNDSLKFPGARRAAKGVIIEDSNGGFYHFQDSYSEDQTKDFSINEMFFIAFCSRTEILRMRSLNNAHDALLHYRAMAIVDNARMVRVMRHRRDIYERAGRPWSLTQYYHSMDEARKSYISYLPKKHQKTLKHLPAGMAFINEANAICKRSFCGDFVVVSEALEKLFYFMTIGIFGHQFEIQEPDRMAALLISLRIMVGTETLDFDLDTRGVLPVNAERAIQKLVKSQIEFTFGHEYSHYLLGHLEPPDMGINSPSSSSIVDNTSHSHEKEHEADLYSIKFIENNLEAQKTTTIGAYSTLLFLSFLEEIQLPGMFDKYSPSKTHPKSIDRIWKLSQLLKNPVLTDREINRLIDEKHNLQAAVEANLSKGQMDLTTVGSIYMPSYKYKKLRDRIDY